MLLQLYWWTIHHLQEDFLLIINVAIIGAIITTIIFLGLLLDVEVNVTVASNTGVRRR